LSSATVHRQLRAGTPVWLARGRRPAVHHAKNPGSIEPDVIVVGAGISGALITDALVTAGKSVAVFDRRGPLQGSTSASTALLQFEIDTPLSELGRKIGRERAARAWWRSADGVEHLRARILDLGLDCDFEERCSIYLPGDLLDMAGLKHEAALRRAAGLRSAMIGRKELKTLTGIARAGAILSYGTAEVNPVKLTAGLWRAATARGVKIYAPAIRAGAVIFATGYELAKFIKPTGYKIASTWAYATRIQKENLWPSRCLIWEAADPYLYARTDAAGRIIVGGEDEEFADEETRNRLLPEKIVTIARKLARLMTKVDPTPAHAWCGSFGQSPTGLPLIGAIPRHANCYAVLGFGGNGITFSAIATQVLQRQLCGLPDPDQDLFRLG